MSQIDSIAITGNVNCTGCGKPLTKWPAEIKRNKTGNWFCSKECRTAVTNTMVDKTCSSCERTFAVKAYRKAAKFFCSVKCRRKRIIIACDGCGKEIEKRESHVSENNYCSRKCASSNRFKSGFTPWNKGMAGLQLSPATQFSKGHVPTNVEPVGTVKIRTRKRDGKQRAWVKIAEPNKWQLRAQIVWIEHFGDIPDGKVVHHKNRDTLDDSPGNLEALTKAEHLDEHRHEFKRRRYWKTPAAP